VYPWVKHTPGGFEASKFTQVPLQPSCIDSWLQLHPPSSQLSIVRALGQWSPTEREKSFTAWNGARPDMARRPLLYNGGVKWALGPGRLCLKHHRHSVLLFPKNEPIILLKLPIIPVLSLVFAFYRCRIGHRIVKLKLYMPWDN